MVPIWDPKTGRRRYVFEATYEEMVAKKEGRTTPIYCNKTNKEHEKMPATSNRKPQFARRLEVLNGLVKAKEKLANEEIVWATLAEFDDYYSTFQWIWMVKEMVLKEKNEVNKTLC